MQRTLNTTSGAAPTFVPWHDGLPRGDGDRRAHERQIADRLDWLRCARLTTGAELSLIDLSPGGALFETSSRLRPGTTATLTLTGNGIVEIATFRLLRCEVATIRNGLVYRGACVFDRVLRLPKAPGNGSDSGSQLLAAEAAAPAHAANGLSDAHILGLIQSVARRTSETRSEANIAAIMPETRAAIERGDPPQVILRLIEARLGVAASRTVSGREASRGDRPEPFRPATAHAGIDPRFAIGWNRIVVRYLDGRLLKGFTQDFQPARPSFHVSAVTTGLDVRPVLVPMQQLKAVFFVRDFDGDPAYVERPTFDQGAAGRRIEVTFLDDEVLLGSTLGYRSDGSGFFVTPADGDGNNLRVFVLPGAVRHIRYV